MPSQVKIDLDFFLGFGRALRAEGVQLGSAEIELFTKALAKAAVKNLRDIYWVGRVCLTTSPEQIPIYDRIFQQWFQNRGDATFPAAIAIQQTDSLSAASRSPTVAVEVLKRSGSSSGRAAAWEERLGLKRVQPPDVNELSTMQTITKSLNTSPPVRRSRRFRAGGRSGPIHLRRILRTSYRTGGEFFRLIRSRRLVRVRPLVLLIDVSKSMTAHSRAFVQFARAALRRKGRTEVLCFGTQLTVVTKLLRADDVTAALERTSTAVQDWDGGTRLSSALEELFRSSRQTQSIRGAIVILLSDGLERGSCEMMAKNIARLSRLAHQLIWINPLWVDPLFEPRAGAIRTILPFVDKVYGCQDLNDVATIIPNLFTDS
jgi:Protein containing von Willebrand factor type A (vWA) domain